ncbi:unnamed protein product [Oppiella nova]|uniref:Nuclear receptor domain-containing protein n=1 Tax=Oppiella nova TaxID=334625 RepID=A0A7R9QCA6_9ACAR|nr:unnamed protein product [Oppiella nova]CAG2162067.1 unnamed protein product [Oppiella nova]
MKEKVDKICEICSDKGIGRHFGAITCESCKAFFRRNANKDKEFILTDKEREERRQLVEDNRRKRKQLTECQKSSQESDLPSNPSSNKSSNPSSNESTISCDSDSDFLGDITACVLDVSDEDLSAQIMEIEDYVNNEDSDQSIETLSDRLMLQDINERSQQIAVIPLFKELTDYNGLNELEANKIGELLGASKLFDYPTSKNIIKLTDKLNFDEYLRSYSQKSEETVKETLNYSKMLSAFTSVCPEDHDEISSEYKYYSVFKQLFEDFLCKFMPYWKKDRVILELINAIALFNPNRPNLKHRHNIRLEQQLYIYLLQRYLLLKCRSDCESQERGLQYYYIKKSWLYR